MAKNPIVLAVLDYANESTQFASPGDKEKTKIAPTLKSLPDEAFFQFQTTLMAFMAGRGIVFTFFPDNMRLAKTWKNVAAQIAINQA
ncbi:MAG: hypothetical protein AABO58_04090 [Acidobacteriota bacterium]